MSKIAIYCVALAATLGAGLSVAQAREIQAWGHTFTVDDGPAVAVAPVAPRFNATVTNPARFSRRARHAIDLDQAK